MDDLSSIRIHKETQERLDKLAKELGITVTGLASSMLEKQMDAVEDQGTVNLIVRRGPDSKPQIKLQ